MDNYIVSARKYRPSTFHSVVGQKSLTTTLKNAIENNKLAHAYLFCGPRGVGKTTCARIFAKTINCFHPTADGEACNRCESCVAFEENRSYNIHELDAASNNSVDDIRVLIEKVRIPPQIGKYSVYIIDEVHMLSTQAFNAFLKTLEEPPHYAIFILATTEKHKILPTILSRCQVYDFTRININDIVDNLEYIASQENISADREALNVIAQKADGGMRDALSMFDQLVSYSGGNVSYQAVIENLNVLDYEYYFRLSGHLLKGDVSASMLLLNEILSKGFDGQHFVSCLSSFFRDVLVSKDPQTLVLFELGDAVKEKYKSVAAAYEVSYLYKAIELANECDLAYRASKNKRLLVEILLIRLCQINHPQSTEDDKKKNKLEPIAVPKEAVSSVPSAPPVSQPAPRVEVNASVPVAVNVPVTPPSEKAEAPKTKVLNRPLMGFSIKNPKQGAEEIPQKKVVNPVEVSENRPFTREMLESVWFAYANNLQEKPHLKNTMLSIMPELKGDFGIEVVVYNPEQAREFNEEATELMSFLRYQLRNTSIRMNVRVTEDTGKHRVYSEKEKFDMMVEKEPSLAELVKEFNLRLY